MVRTASDLYDSLKSFSSIGETSLCHLHKPCNGHPLCSMPSRTSLLDFDYIEKKLAKGKRSTLPSCDGVTLNITRSVFCFVEIKGWKEFVSHNIGDENNLSEVDKITIKEKVVSYKLKEKLIQSIKDCEIITEHTDLFPTIPYAYIIVTDINSDKSAIEDIAANLSSLAETSSVWTYCEETMKDFLKNVNITVKKIYAHCREFDNIISQIVV